MKKCVARRRRRAQARGRGMCASARVAGRLVSRGTGASAAATAAPAGRVSTGCTSRSRVTAPSPLARRRSRASKRRRPLTARTPAGGRDHVDTRMLCPAHTDARRTTQTARPARPRCAGCVRAAKLHGSRRVLSSRCARPTCPCRVDGLVTRPCRAASTSAGASVTPVRVSVWEEWRGQQVVASEETRRGVVLMTAGAEVEGEEAEWGQRVMGGGTGWNGSLGMSCGAAACHVAKGWRAGILARVRVTRGSSATRRAQFRERPRIFPPPSPLPPFLVKHDKAVERDIAAATSTTLVAWRECNKHLQRRPYGLGHTQGCCQRPF